MKKKFIIDVSKRLIELRNVLGIQKKDMARDIGFESSYLSQLENGKKTNPGFAFLHQISIHYNVSLDYLVHGIGEMFLPSKESDEQRIKNFKPVFNDLEDLVWFLKRSSFAKNSIMGFAVKFFLENKDIIKLEMMSSLEQEKGSDDEAGSSMGKD